MEKQTAINLLGGTPKKAALALGYRAVQTAYLWPDVLTPGMADRVLGAAARIKTTAAKPKRMPSAIKKEAGVS